MSLPIVFVAQNLGVRISSFVPENSDSSAIDALQSDGGARDGGANDVLLLIEDLDFKETTSPSSSSDNLIGFINALGIEGLFNLIFSVDGEGSSL